MTTPMTRSRPEVAALLDEVVSSARFLVDAKGSRTDVVLSLAVWQHFLSLLEDLEDRDVVRSWLPKLRQGPAASGALSWADVAGSWDDEDAVEELLQRI